MSVVTFFEGKLQVQSLQIVDQPANRKEVRARLYAPTGELAVLADGEMPIMHLACVELKRGVARGNHFHKRRHEYFYVIAGEVNLYAKDLVTGETIEAPLRVGDLARISPEIVHTFLPLREGHAIEFAPEAFDATDVFRHPLKTGG